MNTITLGMLSKEIITEFQELYFQKFNVKLNDEEDTRRT